MQKHDLNEGSVELPVWVFDRSLEEDEGLSGFWFSFEEPAAGDEVDLTGPYPTREAALETAAKVAHEALRAQAAEHLLSCNQDH